MGKTKKLSDNRDSRPMTIRIASDQGLLGSDSSSSGRNLYLSAIAKPNSEFVPYSTANEWICGEIGRFIRLPIPPFCVARHNANGREEFWFSSLDANLTGEELPRADFEKCAKNLPRFATGMLLFDILIMNPDRHGKNFHVDYKSSPARSMLFDHGHALFGHIKGKGRDRLMDMRDSLGVDHSHTGQGGTPHGVAAFLETDDFVTHWLERIKTIPDKFIDLICFEAIPFGISKEEAWQAAKTLKERRNNILSLVLKHADQFVKMKATLFGPKYAHFVDR